MWETTCLDRGWSFSQKSIKITELYGRVAQLGEHLLCKHAFISPKSLNRRLLTLQNPLLVGLLIALHNVIGASTTGAFPNAIHQKTQAARTLETLSSAFYFGGRLVE